MSKAGEAGYPAGPPPTYQGGPPQPYPQAQPQPQPYPQTQPLSQPPYPQPPPAGAPPVIMTQPAMVMQAVTFRETPVSMTCPHCQASITTTVTFEAGTITWVSAGVICLVGCWLGCCLIPFAVDALQDAVHTCPNCTRQVGRYNRM